MKLLFIILSIFLYFQPIFAKKVALLVETAPGRFLYTNKDIETIKKILNKDFEITTIPAKRATYNNIKKHLEVMQKLKKNDIFLFYYSGHGANASTGSEEEDGKDDFLVPIDYKIKNEYIYNILLDNELNYLYSKIPAKKIIIIDACHSATMYKGFKNDKYDKYKDFKNYQIKNPFPKSAAATNIIHFAAAKETETAEGSNDGGIFTLAIKKSLEENGNMPFTTLLKKTQENIRPIALKEKRKGLFTPKLYAKGLNPNNIYTKDIFIIPNNISLKSYLDSIKPTINLKIHNNKNSFNFGERVILKANIDDTKSYIYLIEMLSFDKYKILDKRQNNDCIKVPNKEYRVCQYKNLIARPPFGKSNIYILQTKQAIFTNKELIYQEKTLKVKLQKTNFKLGKTSFSIHG